MNKTWTDTTAPPRGFDEVKQHTCRACGHLHIGPDKPTSCENSNCTQHAGWEPQ